MTTSIIILLYGNHKAIERGFEAIYRTKKSDFPVYVLNNHYPLWPEGFAEGLQKQYGFEMLDAGRNVGLAGGLNFMLKNTPYTDLNLLMDCDAVPLTEGWDIALTEVLTDDTIAWAGIWNEVSYREMDERGFTSVVVNGYICREPKQPGINSISGHKRKWIDDIGGFKDENKFYGGSEVVLHQHVNEKNRHVFLDDFKEAAAYVIPCLHEDEYTEYKRKHAIGLGGRFEGSFEDWLKRITVVVLMFLFISCHKHSVDPGWSPKFKDTALINKLNANPNTK